jgi:hypothetical protein
VTATEIVTEIRGRGDATKSRRVHGVTGDGQGWIVGCEGYVRNWEKLEGAFDRIINTFSLASQPATETGSMPPAHQVYRWVDKEGYLNYTQTPPPMTSLGLVDRAARFVTGGFERRLGGRLTGVELLPFESKIPGTMKWKGVAPSRDGERIGLPTKILVEFPLGWALMVTALGTADNDAVARSILSSLRTTSAPECFWPVYRNMMNAAGRGSQAVETERKFRESAAAGDPRSLTLTVDFGEGLTFYFDNNGQVRPCHTFQLTGRWVPGDEPGLLVTSDRRSVVGVEFLSPERLSGSGY